MTGLSISDLNNESDVEQKFIYQLLTSQYPIGLGYNPSDIRTKLDIRKIAIDKGTKKSIYYPDYLIVMNGLPLVVIEAKEPNVSLDEALKEARLYATEINSNYPNAFNPCSKLIVSNGQKTIFTDWDSVTSLNSFSFDEVDISSQPYFEFLEFVCKDTLNKEVERLKSTIRKETLFLKPTDLLGGKSIQNASLGENSFGSNVSFEYRHLFNPLEKEERTNIALNAYVASKRRLSHVDPIDRLIRATLTPSFRDSRLIADTESPDEVIEALTNANKIRNQILLFIGSVGSGKSTFIDYLREVALPKEISKRTFWLSVDMNNSPAAKDLIYNWLLERSIDNLQEQFKEFDFDSLEFLKTVFARPISQFDKGPITLFGKGSDKYASELYNLITGLRADKDQFFKYLTEYLISSRGNSLIFVLDNVDKRNRDAQLLMFEVANWLKSQYQCTVFLPLREVTFDHYRKEPPLDTVIKEFVFRIDPPLLDQVIYKRFEYLVRELKNNQSSFHYILRNGSKVECKRDDVKNYLSSILKSLFQNKFFKRLITGLTDRNIRKGLEIFLDFCKSGHFHEGEILKMRLGSDDYEIPNHLITRILLRGNRRYFADGSSPILNVFNASKDDVIPDPFVRIAILQWLSARKSEQGPSKTKGYHKIESLLQDLQSLGHNEQRVVKELEVLIRASCIVTETQSVDLNINNLICITAAGVVHIELLSNIDYLSTVAEDTIFKSLQVATAIKENIAGKDVGYHLNKQNRIENSKLLLDYLEDYKKYFPFSPKPFLSDGKWTDLHSLEKPLSILDQYDKNIDLTEDNIMLSQYPKGEIIEGQVVDIKEYGIFIEFGLGAKGFAHISEMTKEHDPTYIEEHYDIGDTVICEVVDFNPTHGRFKLKV